MIINNTNIIYYIVAAIVGIVMGVFVHKYNEKVFNKESNVEEKAKDEKTKINLLVLVVIMLLYLGIIYKFGITIETLKYLILTPMLISALIIDFKLQIIPNRLNLTMFELGVGFAFAYTFIDLNVSIDSILGMFVGGGIFLFITLIGGLIAGKEAMGFGDVKLMGALGLFFGIKSIVMITVLAFLLGAIISIGILIIRAKKKSEYIPFGPFIVIAAIVTIFVPQDLLFGILVTIFSLGLNRKKELV